MLSKTKVLSAIVGLAMLGLPTAAFAGHHDGHFRGYGWHERGDDGGWRGGWHNRGWHNGWYRHGDDDDDGGRRWGNPGWNGYRGGWGQYGYGCRGDDDGCGGGFWNRFHGEDDGYFPGRAYNPNQLNSLLAQRQRTTIELQRMRAQGDSRGAARMAGILQGLNGRIARDRGGYGYAPLTPSASYPGGYNGYGGYPYYGNTANAFGALVGPLLGVR